ncbi:hypothetical protein ACQZ5D_03620 [Agrobacterium sp. 22-211-1]
MGQKYAAFDEFGKITGFYDSIDSPVPDGVNAIEITDAEWLACLATEGYSVLDGQLSPPSPPTEAELLERARKIKIADLSAACEAAIVGGYQSNALGAVHTYPSNIKDQINMMGSVSDSLLPNLPADWITPFWVCDADGLWSWKMHNAPQIQQAGRNGKAHVVECQTALATLTASVNSAETPEAVAAVVWPEGAAA